MLLKLKNVISLLENNSNNVLMLSRKHCHTRNVHSIVLKGDFDNRLTRIFLAQEDHLLWKNLEPNGVYEVGPHTHMYDLSISCGPDNVRNVIQLEYKKGPGKFSEELDSYKFYYRLKDKNAKIEPCGKTLIHLTAQKTLDSSYYLVNTTIHTIGIRKGEKGSWTVQENTPVNQPDHTMLYSNQPAIQTEGLYEPFESVEEIRSMVSNFFYGKLEDEQ